MDLFRIKIWDVDDGDAIVYDNQIGCSDIGADAEPCTAVHSGSIVIHGMALPPWRGSCTLRGELIAVQNERTD